MKLAYFDCFAGSAGDMIVGALLDAGADIEKLKAELAKLELPQCSLGAERVTRGGICGTKFTVETSETGDKPRGPGDIMQLIRRAELAPRAAERSVRIVTRLAEAEAKVHGIAVEDVHFHEVGAVDGICDVVGACVALELLEVDRVVCSPIPLGGGTISCEHGKLPAPSPATAELVVGAKTRPIGGHEELTTPTAAAILTTLSASYGPPPEMNVSAVGYGAGARTEGPLPNLLRVFIGEPADLGTLDAVVELSANIDDCTGEMMGSAIDKLLAAGCLDAWVAPIYMKKCRPAWMLSAICEAADVAEAERIIFTETTTFGIRRRPACRTKLTREHKTVETQYGPIRIKVGRMMGQTLTAVAEFSDCAAAAETHGVAVRQVMRAAETAYGEAIDE